VFICFGSLTSRWVEGAASGVAIPDFQVRCAFEPGAFVGLGYFESVDAGKSGTSDSSANKTIGKNGPSGFSWSKS